MYAFVREEFSFDKLYYLCIGIFLNECYGCTLVYIGSLVVKILLTKNKNL